MNVQTSKRLVFLFLFACVIASWFVMPPTAYGQQDPVLVLVAGNPDLYPIEYFDADEQRFKGLIPDLLQRFSEEGRYRVQYLDHNIADMRISRYKNKQADLVSGCQANDGFLESAWQDGLTVLQTVENDTMLDYRIIFTEIADETLKQDLTAFFSGVTGPQRDGLLIEETQRKEENHLMLIIWSCVLTALPLFLAALLIIRRYRLKLRDSQGRREMDRVTGIANFDAFTSYYRQMVTDKNRILYNLIYFYVDTDKLRHLVGDQETNEFFRYLAVTFHHYIAVTDILARISDEGFAILKLTATSAEAEEWIQPVFDKIRRYGGSSANAFHAVVSAGIYPLKAHDRDLHTLLFNAEKSCSYARTNHLDYAVCSEEILTTYGEDYQLQERIPRALEQGEFLIYLHFFVDTQTSQIVGAEALSRWQHPEHGLIKPGRYIPLMEQDGSILKLDFYVLKRVCGFLENLHAKGENNFFISCNFSRHSFVSDGFVDECLQIIGQFSFPREALIFELTESGIAQDVDIVYQNAMRLKEFGVSIALDDFGSGSSFFMDLERYQFDGLKLDKSLIDHLETEEGEIILDGIIQIGHRLGMTVLAEGVENHEQVEKLQRLKCGAIQGFYFYKPLPLTEAERIYLQQVEKMKAGLE